MNFIYILFIIYYSLGIIYLSYIVTTNYLKNKEKDDYSSLLSFNNRLNESIM